MITFRNAVAEDKAHIGRLIFETVHGLRQKGYEYTDAQLYAWAPTNDYYSYRYLYDRHQYCYVAYDKDLLVGFGCISDFGYISAIYTHIDYFRKKIASKIMDAMETKAISLGNKTLSIECATPAVPLLKFKGFMTEVEQTIMYNGQDFVCRKMHKNIVN